MPRDPIPPDPDLSPSPEPAAALEDTVGDGASPYAVHLGFAWRVLALGMMVAAVIGVGEGLARVVVSSDWLLPVGDIGAPPEDQSLWADPYLLWEPRRGTYFDGGSTVTINHLGFRGPETMSLEKAPGTFRVMVTGDSSVYGFGVEDGQTFADRLQTGLDARLPQRRFEVINAAVPAWSTYQSLNMLRVKGFRMGPDLLIVGNLFSDNNFDTFVDREELEAMRMQRLAHQLCARLDRFVLFRTLRTAYHHLRPPTPQPPRHLRVAVKDGPPTGRRRVPLEEYQQNLLTIAREADAVHCRVAFLLLANREDLSMMDLGQWIPYREAMRAVAKQVDAPIADYPDTVFVHILEGADALFLDKMHPTARGHVLMADTTMEALLGHERTRRWLETGGGR